MRQLSLDYIAAIKLHISLQQKFPFCSHDIPYMRQLSLDYIATIKLHISLQQKFLFCSHDVLGQAH